MEKKEITDIKSIAESFNRYLTEIGSTLAKKVDSSSVNFHKYLEAYNIARLEKDLTVNELKDAFFSLKKNKRQVTMKLVLMLLRNVSEVCMSFYFIDLMLHYEMELFQMSLELLELLPYLKMKAIQT